MKEPAHNLLPGFHTVREALITGQIRIKELWVAEGKKSARAKEILEIAKKQNIPVVFKNNAELSSLFPEITHQGFAALVEKFSYSDIGCLLESSSQSRSLIIALDHITDVGNMGAIIRTASFFGAHGLIIPKDRSAAINAKVIKRSSGAYVHLPIARVVNLGRTLDRFEKKGYWIIGTSGESKETIYNFDWNRNVVLVFGNEQRGITRNVLRRCHQVLGIPSSGPVESLNVSVAAGVFLSEIVRQRNNGQLG